MERLAETHPLHGGLLARWRLVEDCRVGTMAIGMSPEGKIVLKVDPDFVEQLTMAELSAVLHHEANHVVLGHVTHQRSRHENGRARIIAEEVTANEWVSGKLPGLPIVLADFACLSPNESTDARYNRLLEQDRLPLVETLDDHGTWAELTDDLGQLAVQIAVGTAWDRLTPAQRAKVEPEIAKLVGSGGGTGDAVRVSGGRASIPWQRVLRRYVGRALAVRPIFGRVPRRFPELVGILPGRGRLRDKPHVLAVIDTSASLSDADLGDISAELGRLARHYAVTVVECDRLIRAVYRYKPVTSVHGRGGTDLRPALKEGFLRQQKADLVVYFTDGRGKAPEKPPHIRVIWVLTATGKRPCTWGEMVRMGGE